MNPQEALAIRRTINTSPWREVYALTHDLGLAARPDTELKQIFSSPLTSQLIHAAIAVSNENLRSAASFVSLDEIEQLVVVETSRDSPDASSNDVFRAAAILIETLPLDERLAVLQRLISRTTMGSPEFDQIALRVALPLSGDEPTEMARVMHDDPLVAAAVERACELDS